MDVEKMLTYFGYAISLFLFGIGVAVLAGFLFPVFVPDRFRILFGLILVLYGVYRFVTLRIKRQRKNEEQLLS
jgi:hypothetical protein